MNARGKKDKAYAIGNAEEEIMQRGDVLNTFRFYSHALIQLLIEPALFFRALPENSTPGRVWGFLGCGAGFFALASLLTGVSIPGPPAFMALVFAANAVGMVIIGAAIGFAAMVMMFGRRGPFLLVLGIYVFASGITWLVSWLPFMLWFTEPWRWWLTVKGFRFACGLSGRQALCVVLVSVPVQWCLVYSAMLAFMR